MRTEGFRGVLLSTLVIASLITPLLLLSPSPVHAALTQHDPILIDGNVNFTPANGVNGGGSGTLVDPYIIENYIISASTAHGIWIGSTTAYFVVRNCVVENGKGHFHDGIYLNNVTNGKIENNTCKNNDWAGIRLRGSLNILVGNTCVNNDERGIDMGGSSNTLINNTCSNSRGPGIIIYGSSHTLASNTCSTNSSTGIRLYGSLTTLDNNTCSNNSSGPGIQVMSSSSSNTLINNTCSNNSVLAGISVSGSSHTLVSNTCSTNSYNGIYLWYNSDNNTLDNNACSNNGSNGIFLVGSDSNLLTNNTCENNDECGIKTEIYYPPTPLSPLTEEDVDSPENNSIFHNCLLSNGGNNAYDEGSNYWDDGYPSGGNYWSDYAGADNYRGVNQDRLGSDGIGDTPYYISGDNNRDRYPLVNPWPRGTAVFKLENLYTVRLDVNLYLENGSKLVVKFYTYSDSYQGENVVWSGTTPDSVSFSKIVPHPQGASFPQAVPVERTKLDLTADNTENVIATIATFTVTRDDLHDLNVIIYMEWPFVPPDRRNHLFAMISDKYLQWPFSP